MGGPKRAFSMIELTVSLAVLMVLASLAIPMVADAQLKARKSELLVNVDGLQIASDAYQDANDVWFAASFAPDLLPGKTARPWGGISAVGFEPDGPVRGSYTLAITGSPRCYMTALTMNACSGDLCAAGMTDLDLDGNRSCVFRTNRDPTPVWINASGF